MLTISMNDRKTSTQAGKFLGSAMIKARRSALGSVGWWIRGQLRNHIEYGGAGWKPLHPIAKKFRKKRNVGAKWFGRRRHHSETPYFWLGKFARYKVDRPGHNVWVDFGRSRAGQSGQTDPQIVKVVKRAERGERIRVTGKMRRFFGTTRRKRPKKQIVGQHYFPLKKTTRWLVIPPRKIFAPVEKRIKPLVPALFKKKFLESIQRNTKWTWG